MAYYDYFIIFQAFCWEARPFKKRQASYRDANPLKGRPASQGRPGLSQGDQASYRETGPLTGRPVSSQGGRASHKKPGLS